jgi:ethanolamine transporter EutH
MARQARAATPKIAWLFVRYPSPFLSTMEDLSFLDAMASTGCVISLAHKAAMQSSFPLLKKQNKFSKVMFFGKVMGKVGDYLIAVGIEESFLSGKKFFFW